VLLGNGDGTLQAGLVFAARGGSVVAGDFNGDGVPDLAVAGGANDVSVLLGNGDGTSDLRCWCSPLFRGRGRPQRRWQAGFGNGQQ